MPHSELAQQGCVNARFAFGGNMASDTQSGTRVGYAVQRPVWTSRERAAHYREQAAQFERMAEEEAEEASRDRLLDLARQYDRLAIKLDAEPGRQS